MTEIPTTSTPGSEGSADAPGSLEYTVLVRETSFDLAKAVTLRLKGRGWRVSGGVSCSIAYSPGSTCYERWAQAMIFDPSVSENAAAQPPPAEKSNDTHDER